MKKIIICLILFKVQMVLFGQTGPGGVGNSSTNVLWLKGDGITGLTNGATLSNWPDLSGNANDLIQTSATSQPMYQEGVINGLPVVRFNSTHHRLIKNPFSTFPSSAITAIYINQTTDANDGILSYATGTSNDSNEFLIFNSNNLKFHRGANTVNTGVDVNDNAFNITDIRWRSSDGDLSIFINGLSAYSGTVSAPDIPTGGSLVLASEQDEVDGGYNSVQAHQGDFAEVILFNTYLNEAQNIVLNNYLGAKYDISIANDYYAFETNHPHDLAGIGRVDVNNIHSAAMSNDILKINTASDLDDGEFLFFGHDNGDILTWTNSESPSSVEYRLQREWRVDETGDIGSVSIEIDVSQFPTLPIGYSNYQLLVDADGDFSSGAVTYDLTNIEGTTVHSYDGFTLNDGDYVTVALNNFIQFTLVESSGFESEDLILEIETSAPVSTDVTVELNIVAQTATSGLDFTIPTSTIVTVLAGNTTAPFTIPIIDDGDTEDDESFQVLLNNPSGGVELGANASFEYTIEDNDNSRKIYFNAASSSNNESVTSVSIPVTLSEADLGAVTTIDFAVVGGTASAGDDYTLNSGTITFAAGETSATISLEIIADDVFEADETIVISLSNPTNANLSTTSPIAFTYTILNDDLNTSIAFSSATGSGDENTTDVSIELVLNESSNLDVSVDYAVSGSSTAGEDDYLLSDGALTITSGNITGTIDFTVLRDAVIESDEDLIITISNPVNTNLGSQTQFTYTITDSPVGHTGPGGVGDVNTMVMWLRSEDLQLTDGDAVETWPDASGNGNDLEQSEPDFRPTFKTNQVEGLPAVQFDGINDRLEKNNFSSMPSSQYTIFTNFRKASDFEGGVYSYASVNSASELELFWNDIFEINTSSFGITTLLNFLQNPNINTFTAFVAANGLHPDLVTYTYDMWGFRDISNSSSGGQSITAGGRFALGAGQVNATTYDTDKGFFDGDFTEKVLYNVYLNEAQRYIISSYLGIKYNHSSDHSRAVQHFKDKGFTYEIAGIGQDGSSGKHVDAQGSGVVRVNNPQGMSDLEYFIWGHNNGSLAFNNSDVPSEYNLRLDRSWLSLNETNSDNIIGKIDNVDISFDLGDLPTLSTDNVVLLVDGDGDFSTGSTVVSGGTIDGDDIIKFSAVSAITHGTYFTLAINQPTVEFTLGTDSGSESINEVSIEITMSEAPTTDITVDYTVAPITALGDEVDYVLANGSVIITAGSTTANIIAAISDDTIDESNETFSVTLSAATDAVLGATNVFTYTIIDEPIGHSGPGGIGQQSTMTVWLKSEDLELTAGSAVTAWPDASGNGNNLEQPVTSLSPIFNESVANGFPAVQFDGVDDRMAKNNFPSFPSTSFTIINISQDDFDISQVVSNSYYSIGGNSEIAAVVEDFAFSKRNYFFYGQKGFTTNSENSQGVFAMSEIRWSNSTYTATGVHRYSGASSSLSRSVQLSIPTAPSLVIGAGQSSLNGFDDFYDGSYTEFVAYSKPLNDTQILISRAYFASKYDLIVPSFSRVYEQSTPANGDFDFDVAGIGQLSATDYHIDAQGTGIVRVNNAQGLQDLEFLTWGHNGNSLNELSNDVPEGVAIRLERVWRVSERELSLLGNNDDIYISATGDIGAIDISFDLTGLGNVDVADLVLLVDDDGVFVNGATSITSPVHIGNNIYQFSGVTAIDDNDYFTLSTADQNDTPLPVELISFEGEVINNNAVILKWTTATEFNNSHFVVERSSNGEDFETVSVVDGKGGSNESTEYNLTDPYPETGRNYYRLKQYDFSGSFEYSSIVSLMLDDQPSQSVFTLAPNPVDLGGDLELKVNTPFADHYAIEIIDPTGRSLLSHSFVSQPGENITRINTNSLTRGVNFMLIKGARGDIKRFKVLIK